MAVDGGCWHDDLADRVGRIVRAERDRLARRRPELSAADLGAVEDTLWRIADHLLLRRARQVAVDPAAAARLWDIPVRTPANTTAHRRVAPAPGQARRAAAFTVADPAPVGEGARPSG